MTDKNKLINSIFTDTELEHLPLTYRKMEVQDTEQLGELNINASFSTSERHFSKQYMVFVSHKPISNFLELFSDD